LNYFTEESLLPFFFLFLSFFERHKF